MDIFTGIGNLPENYKNAVVCIGNFDGIHHGHQNIINRCIEEAQKTGVASLLVTFDRHPRNVFAAVNGQKPIPVLNTNEEKNEILRNTRMKGILYLKTNTDFLSAEPEEFLKNIIVNKIKASKVIVGYDFRFGRNRKGDVDLMMYCGEKYDFQVIQIDAFTFDGEIVSSSRIRQLLKAGDLEKSEKLLGYQYYFSGTIVHGSGRGAELGFPTANVKLNHADKLVPSYGVYLTKIKIKEEFKFGLCNIGVRPTFNEHDLVLEIYIYDNKQSDLYGEKIKVTLLHRMRDEIKYSTVSELIEQMNKDKQNGLEIIKQYN
jgi:riboflavin kinase/FMN adenylyltransferase